MATLPPQMTAATSPEGNVVCIAKLPDGTYSVYPDNDDASGAPETPDMEANETAQGIQAKTIDEALSKAREMLEGDDGGMSVEEAFGQGFKGSEISPSTYS